MCRDKKAPFGHVSAWTMKMRTWERAESNPRKKCFSSKKHGPNAPDQLSVKEIVVIIIITVIIINGRSSSRSSYPSTPRSAPGSPRMDNVENAESTRLFSDPRIVKVERRGRTLSNTIDREKLCCIAVHEVYVGMLIGGKQTFVGSEITLERQDNPMYAQDCEVDERNTQRKMGG